MARYKLVKTPNPNKDGKEMPYHARYAAYGTVNLDDLIGGSGGYVPFNSGVIKGVVQFLQEMIIRELKFGNNVELDGIGTFTVALQCPPVMNKKEIRAESIQFRTLLFRPSVKICDQLKTIPLYRLPEEKGNISFSLEERRERLTNRFTKQKRITGNDYVWMNHCSRASASRDLKLFCKEGLIERHGRGPTIYYVRKETIEEIK